MYEQLTCFVKVHCTNNYSPTLLANVHQQKIKCLRLCLTILTGLDHGAVPCIIALDCYCYPLQLSDCETQNMLQNNNDPSNFLNIQVSTGLSQICPKYENTNFQHHLKLVGC